VTVRRLGGSLAGALLVVAGCASPPAPSPVTTPAAAQVALDVTMAGPIGCAQFPYWCYAVVSVLPPGSPVDDAWRPPASDHRWLPDTGGAVGSADHLAPSSVDGAPVVAPGRHRVVVSLLGSYDTPSFDANGTEATDLLARCIADVEVIPNARPSLIATFTTDGTGFGGSCSLHTAPG
jgi:hypothetical protein